MNFDTLTAHNFEMPKQDTMKIGSFVGMYEASSLVKLFPTRMDRRKMARLTLFMLQFRYFQVDYKSNGLEGKTGKAGVLIGESLLEKVKGAKRKSTGTNNVDFYLAGSGNKKLE